MTFAQRGGEAGAEGGAFAERHLMRENFCAAVSGFTSGIVRRAVIDDVNSWQKGSNFEKKPVNGPPFVQAGNDHRDLFWPAHWHDETKAKAYGCKFLPVEGTR